MLCYIDLFIVDLQVITVDLVELDLSLLFLLRDVVVKSLLEVSLELQRISEIQELCRVEDSLARDVLVKECLICKKCLVILIFLVFHALPRNASARF